MKPDQITAEQQDGAVTIRFMGALHFKFCCHELVAIQAWMIGAKRKNYVIEFTFRTCVQRCEYDVESKWRRVLELLDGMPIFAAGFE